MEKKMEEKKKNERRKGEGKQKGNRGNQTKGGGFYCVT
jgi:hypothetical protein